MTSPTAPTTDGDQRFAFGENWTKFSKHLDDERIARAVESLRELLKLDPEQSRPLAGKRFLDIGSGSGLFSLAAVRLGASVTSMDIDRSSFQCTLRLQQTYATRSAEFPEPELAPEWQVLHASVLDEAAMATLPTYDFVYSWGVLHHTGEMDRAIRMAASKVAPRGWFALAIYNDQGGGSRRWRSIKHGYHRLPAMLRPIYVAAIAGVFEARFAVARLASGRNPLPLADWRAKKKDRGMSVWHDWVDWIGGLPFEFAKPEAIIMPLRREGFVLENLKTVGNGWGCNEYLFSKPEPSSRP